MLVFFRLGAVDDACSLLFKVGFDKVLVFGDEFGQITRGYWGDWKVFLYFFGTECGCVLILVHSTVKDLDVMAFFSVSLEVLFELSEHNGFEQFMVLWLEDDRRVLLVKILSELKVLLLSLMRGIQLLLFKQEHRVVLDLARVSFVDERVIDHWQVVVGVVGLV
jgi:hypothetical protein